MSIEAIREKALAEIWNPTFAVTEQYLKIHNLIYNEGIPEIERVDIEGEDGTAIVYLPIENEKFCLAIYLDISPEVEVRGIGTEPYSSVRFVATSETLTLDELSQLSYLQFSTGWNKGDKRGKSGEGVWQYTLISYEPNLEPDAFEHKLEKLLNFLEQDKEGVAKLIDVAKGFIQVAIEFHNGNTMLGGPHLSKDILKRMAELNLAIDFDLYVGGKPFES